MSLGTPHLSQSWATESPSVREPFLPQDVSIAIPTFGRDEVLIDTLRACLDQSPLAGEILVIDQTPCHAPAAERELNDWHQAGRIRWERLARPSIPVAMNHALKCATGRIVLFLDDDIVPGPGLAASHAVAYNDADIVAVVGQIVQPWQQPADIASSTPGSCLSADFDFPFHSTRRAELQNAMAGHMSVIREQALAIGGFDENFRGTAYRFETEFARRILRGGGRIIFEPAASIRHLRAARGGTRTAGNHLASASPIHGVGDYYFAIGNGRYSEIPVYILRRMIRETCTRFHLRRPWYIPVKLVGEIRALCWAIALHHQGPALINTTVKS